MTSSLAEQIPTTTPSRSVEPREIVPLKLTTAQQQLLTLVDRMFDYTHKTLIMDVNLESENKKPILSNIYANQFISVHSNIAHNDTVTLNSKYADVLPNDYLSSPNESTASMYFMMVVNNYYTPKIYDLTNSEIKRYQNSV
jgi:hypothetical protein